MHVRPLTPGEIELGQSIFGDAIDYAKVRLIKGKWWPFHPRNAAMAPTGSIWFHPVAGGWSNDFAQEPLGAQAFFIHELTHVLQAQQRGKYYLPLMRHPFCRYTYQLVPGKPFHRYGLEQQAEMVKHVYLLRRGVRPAGVPPLSALEAVLPFKR